MSNHFTKETIKIVFMRDGVVVACFYFSKHSAERNADFREAEYKREGTIDEAPRLTQKWLRVRAENYGATKVYVGIYETLRNSFATYINSYSTTRRYEYIDGVFTKTADYKRADTC